MLSSSPQSRRWVRAKIEAGRRLRRWHREGERREEKERESERERERERETENRVRQKRRRRRKVGGKLSSPKRIPR